MLAYSGERLRVLHVGISVANHHMLLACRGLRVLVGCYIRELLESLEDRLLAPDFVDLADHAGLRFVTLGVWFLGESWFILLDDLDVDLAGVQLVLVDLLNLHCVRN